MIWTLSYDLNRFREWKMIPTLLPTASLTLKRSIEQPFDFTAPDTKNLVWLGGACIGIHAPTLPLRKPVDVLTVSRAS
jgi:hypothetical protein